LIYSLPSDIISEKTVASFWGNGVVATFFGSMAIQGLEPYASYLKMPGEQLIKPMTPEASR
jgi:hypothetical protein